MKPILTLIIMFCISLQSIGAVEIDGIFHIEFPMEHDTMKMERGGYDLVNYFANTLDGSFIFQVSEKSGYNKSLGLGYPSDVLEYYKSVVEGMSTSMEKNGFKLGASSPIEMNGIQGYRIIVNDPEIEEQIGESLLFTLNDKLYQATYLSPYDYSEKAKETYLESLRLTVSEDDYQYLSENSTAYEMGALVGKFMVYGVILIGILILILVSRRNR